MTAPDAPPLPPTDAVPDRRAFRVLLLIVLADMVGFGIILPILPLYARSFHAADWQVTLALSVYSACQFLASPILGGLSDRVGRRPVLIVSQLGSVAASLTLAAATFWLAGSAAGLWVLYASRVVDGLSGGNLAAAQAYVADTVGPTQRSKYIGLLGAAFGVGFVLGPATGGLLGHVHPSLAPLASAALSLTAAAASYLYLPESLKAPVRHRHGQFRRSAALMRVPVLAQLNVIWFLAMFAFVTAESVFALFLQDVYGFGLWQVGLMFALAGVVIVGVQGRAIGPLVKRFGEWRVAAAGPMVFAAAMGLFAAATTHPVIGLLLFAAVLNAVGRSLQTPVLSALVSQQVTADRQGAAFGLFQGFGSLARVFGPAAAGALYDVRHALPYAVAAGAAVVAGVWTAVLRRRTTHASMSPGSSLARDA